jgi:inner membrane protein
LEPLTHLLTGACMSRAGLNRKTALATLTLVVAAEAPDLDILAYLRGPVYGFAHHRGFTHSFLGVPLVAAVVVAGVYGFHRLRSRVEPAPSGCPACPPVGASPASAPRWGILYLYACLAGLSHILLDFTNNYGVRPFWPFSEKWYSWDIVFIFEPLLYVFLLGALLLPSLFGLIQEEIGVRRRGPRGRGAAIVALVLMVALWGFRDFEHRRALAALDARLYHGEEPLRVSAYPYYLNPFRWSGVVETEDFFEVLPVDSLTPDVDPQRRAVTRFKPEETPVTLAAKESYLGRVYLDWAQYPIVESEQIETPEPGYMVRFFDLRYAYPELRGARLGARVRLDKDLNVVAYWFGPRAQRPDLLPPAANTRGR